jgi:hypothetical protein
VPAGFDVPSQTSLSGRLIITITALRRVLQRGAMRVSMPPLHSNHTRVGLQTDGGATKPLILWSEHELGIHSARTGALTGVIRSPTLIRERLHDPERRMQLRVPAPRTARVLAPIAFRGTTALQHLDDDNAKA